MTLEPGARFGAYEVLSAIGKGGMGEVWRGRDTKLNRDVALKILPEQFATDPDRLARFKREAQVLASLNHPNIGGIHGLEESNGVQALVLELVEGETLADRIARGPIPLDGALPIAKQIAEALEAAHEQGIIHRDLKPANIKVRPDGRVKVLDFGLAKALEPTVATSTSVTQSPTITTASQVGMILGTPAYMSPEQAKGREADKRADIWAFGCVLYETISGRRAFEGETVAETLARLLEREPDWQALPAPTPPRIRGLLRRCLDKDQTRRLQDIADARREIECARDALESRRLAWPSGVAAAVALVVTLATGAGWFAWSSRSSVSPQPISVLIADLRNDTGDQGFDRALEPLLRIVLEGAGFITAYDRSLVNRSLGVRPPEKFDESAAREIAVKQGLGMVLSGSLDRQGSGYGLTVRAVQPVTGTVIKTAQGRASDKDHVLPEATRLVTEIREALGDDRSDSAKRFAMDTLSATSLDVVREYAVAMEASSNGRFDEARRSFAKAAELDPNFGLAYAGVAIMSSNLGREQDAQAYITEAVRHVDRMTERERYRTRGLFYLITGDYQACVKEYGALIARYAADVAAHNNLASCAADLGNTSKAVEEMRRAVEILPKRALYRLNLALYAALSGDFRTAEQEGRTAQELGSPLALLPMALAQAGQGQFPQATEMYEELAKVNSQGASFAASGLADLALYEGRFSSAVRILERGAAADLTANTPDLAARKFATLAYTQLQRRGRGAAVAAAERALTYSQRASIRFLSARALLEAEQLTRVQALADSLRSEIQPGPQAYSKILEGGMALHAGDARRAIAALSEANTIVETWLGHFDLGRAYFEAGAFTQADSEFEWCIRHHARALTLFGNEPSYGYLPPVYYFRGRVWEGLKSAGFATAYRTYLSIRETAGEDPILAEVRQRIRGSSK